MDQTTLVTEYVEGGARLLKAMDQAGLDVCAALWLYTSETSTWRLIVATPKLEQLGPRAIYRKIQSMLAELEPPGNIALDDISVVNPESNLIKSLRHTVKTKPDEIRKIVFTNNSINNVFIEAAVIYRMSKTVQTTSSIL